MNTQFTVADPRPAVWPKVFLGTVCGAIAGAAGGSYIAWNLALEWKSRKYGTTMGGKMGSVKGHQDIAATMTDEHVKATFSTSEIRVLLTALPKTEIGMYEFQEALNNLEEKSSVVKVDKKGLLTVSDPRDKIHRKKRVTDEEAQRLFRMFDLNGDGVVHPTEIITILGLHCSGTTEDKAGLMFDLWDTNRDGRVSKREMKEHYKRLPINNVFGMAMNNLAFKLIETNEKGELTRESFIKSPLVAKYMTKLLINSNYQRFLTKENFKTFSEALNEAYKPELHQARH